MTRIATAAVALSAAAAAAWPAPAAHGHATAGASRCIEPVRHHEGIGRACRTDRGTFRLRIEGNIYETHGYDPVPGRGWAGAPRGGGKPKPSPSPSPDVRAGVCTPAGERRVQVVYAVASDVPDDYAAKKAMVQRLFADADAALDAEARLFGHGGHYRLACASDGTVDVLKVRLPSTAAELRAGGPTAVVTDMYRLGHGHPYTKYWMWLDWELSAQAAGMAMHCYDETALPSNCSNDSSPFYAMTWVARSEIFMHEGGHTLGAVNHGAPHSTGRGHCWDEQDVMCLYDGGVPSSTYTFTCTTQRYDCGHDDYFHPYAPNGSYLADHWNTGACMNGFIVNEGCGKAGTPPDAEAGPDLVCRRDEWCIVLGAGTSDADGDLAYAYWRFVSCPAGCPRDGYPQVTGGPTGTVQAFGFEPKASGAYTLELVVHDRRDNVGRDQTEVMVP